MTIHHFPTPQAEPNHVWPPVRQTYSPYPRGWTFGDPITQRHEEVKLPWWGTFLAWFAGCWIGYGAAFLLVLLASVVW